jgi:hypothetical protein
MGAKDEQIHQINYNDSMKLKVALKRIEELEAQIKLLEEKLKMNFKCIKSNK